LKWDDGLRGVARNIAETDLSPLRVLAGPGTGKTFALMRRVARLLQNGAKPERMLVCTFTRTAAGDLTKELGQLGVEGVENVRAGTLHALCYEIISRTDVLNTMGRTPRLLLNFEERFLLEDLVGDSFGNIHQRAKRLEAFNAAWARLQTDEPGWPTDPIDNLFNNSLQAWLRFHEAMLIGELVPETLRYLRENPACSDLSAFDHVLVDEYQDLNVAEQTLLDLLAEECSLTVIGDEDQSIYSFKYAHPEGIASFSDTHTGTHDESLDTCRRCPSLVIELANKLIANNKNRTSRALKPESGRPPGEVHVVQWRTMRDEAIGIARFIHERIKSGIIKAGRVLVLAPRRQFGYAVRDELNALETPAHSFFHEETLDGNPKQLDDSQAQQAFTLLTLAAFPEDRVALRCWCGFGNNSLRRGAWERIRSQCEMTGDSPHTVLKALAEGSLKLPNCNDVVERFKALGSALSTLHLIRGKGLLDAIFPETEDWSRQFRDIASHIEDDEFDATTLLEALRNGVTRPELPTDVDYVRVMSLHKSKGLTADLVIVVGCIEGIMPRLEPNLSRSEEQRFMEELRRLFYVSITRTTKTLVLSSVTSLPTDLALRMGALSASSKDGVSTTIASRFLNELGPTRPRAIRGEKLLDIKNDG
jgi:ATP-dependent DNA helicase UvrD/PcrA